MKNSTSSKILVNNHECMLTAMYLAIGAKNSQHGLSDMVSRTNTSELDIMSEMVPHAEALEKVALHLIELGYDFPGVWLYEIVEPFGAALMQLSKIPAVDDFLVIGGLTAQLAKWFEVQPADRPYFDAQINAVYRSERLPSKCTDLPLSVAQFNDIATWINQNGKFTTSEPDELSGTGLMVMIDDPDPTKLDSVTLYLRNNYPVALYVFDVGYYVMKH